ncbi:MAG: glycosyltransferase, partial [Methanobacterium sp.]
LDFMTGIISNISDGIPPKYPGKMKINEPVKVQTLDECLFIVPTDIFKMVKFDEELCDDWHLYAVDICLEILKLGFYVYVMPLYLYHRSAGFSISPKYFQTMLKMIKKYKNDYKWINTTTGDWNTRYPFFIQLQINKLLIKIATMRNGHDIP